MKKSRAFYINLDARTDRRTSIETQLSPFFKNLERVKAVETSPGFIGCTLSHIMVLDMCSQDSESDIFFIFEDDFIFEVNSSLIQKTINAIHLSTFDFNIVMLSYHIPFCSLKNVHPSVGVPSGFFHISNSQTATAYCIHKSFVSTLASLWKTSYLHLSEGGDYEMYAIDHVWKTLQTEKCFGCVPRLGKQMINCSNIENKVVSYGGSCLLIIGGEKLNESAIPLCFDYFYFSCNYFQCDSKETIVSLFEWILNTYPHIDYIFKVRDDAILIKQTSENVMSKFGKISRYTIPWMEFTEDTTPLFPTEKDVCFRKNISFKEDVVDNPMIFMNTNLLKTIVNFGRGSEVFQVKSTVQIDPFGIDSEAKLIPKGSLALPKLI